METKGSPRVHSSLPLTPIPAHTLTPDLPNTYLNIALHTQACVLQVATSSSLNKTMRTLLISHICYI
jgi:hypothetical protein